MNIKNIRIQLQSACPELKNLTDKDLNDCKWTIKKMIFMELMSTSICPIFYEQCQDLEKLNESYNLILSKHKANSNNIPKEKLFEHEQNFKTSFLNIIIEGLKLIKWPPAIEPFANLLEPLFTEKQIFLEAIEYILKNACINNQTSNSRLSLYNVNNDNDTKKSDKKTPTSNKKPPRTNLKSPSNSNNTNNNMNNNNSFGYSNNDITNKATYTTNTNSIKQNIPSEAKSSYNPNNTNTSTNSAYRDPTCSTHVIEVKNLVSNSILLLL